jgi:hypothetical protein
LLISGSEAIKALRLCRVNAAGGRSKSGAQVAEALAELVSIIVSVIAVFDVRPLQVFVPVADSVDL